MLEGFCHCECCNFVVGNGSHYIPVRILFIILHIYVPLTVSFSQFLLGSVLRLCRIPVIFFYENRLLMDLKHKGK